MSKMQAHKRPPEDERLVACSLLLLRLGKKEQVRESVPVSLGVALWEKRTWVCIPGLYPRVPSLAPCQFGTLPAQTLWAQERAPGIVRTLPSPRLASFWAQRYKIVKSKSFRGLCASGTLPRSLKGRPWRCDIFAALGLCSGSAPVPRTGCLSLCSLWALTLPSRSCRTELTFYSRANASLLWDFLPVISTLTCLNVFFPRPAPTPIFPTVKLLCQKQK